MECLCTGDHDRFVYIAAGIGLIFSIWADNMVLLVVTASCGWQSAGFRGLVSKC